MYNQLLISLQIEEKWYTFRLFFGILSCYYLHYVFSDSKGERQFAHDLDEANEVVVYAKLPRTFQILTSVGNYAPDWAIAMKRNDVKHIFFIAETKGSMSSMDLSAIERAKIDCAEKLFNSISTVNVKS